MDDNSFRALLKQARGRETAAVLAAVDLDPALLHRVDGGGQQLHHYACIGGDLELVRGLLDRGSDLHSRSNSGGTLLWFAAVNGRLAIADLCLDRGADPCTKNHIWTALGIAAYYGHFQFCIMLLSRGADLRETMGDPPRTALSLYGEESRAYPLSEEDVEDRREQMRAVFASGPHPSQAQRRRDECWARRSAVMVILVRHGFLPLAVRRAELAAAAVPASASIPDEPVGTPLQRHLLRLRKVFCNEALSRLIVGFL